MTDFMCIRHCSTKSTKCFQKAFPFIDGVLGLSTSDGVLGLSTWDGVLGLSTWDGVLGLSTSDGVLDRSGAFSRVSDGKQLTSKSINSSSSSPRIF